MIATRESTDMVALLRIISLCVFFLAAVPWRAIADDRGQSMIHELNVNGTVRTYIVYRPGMPDSKPLPLMIVLHGGLGNARHMERTSGMNGIADSEGFIVAYPDGTGGRVKSMKNRRTWNAGRCCGQAVKQNTDDVSFIARMIDDIQVRYRTDARRVYVAGHSNGAMLAYRLACEIPEKIAAVVAVSGTLAVDSCERAKDVPVLHIHGEHDENVPFAGGRGQYSLANVAHRSVPDTIKLITRPRGCTAAERQILNNDIHASIYHCSGGAPVELYVIEGGGHAWPDGKERNRKRADGQHVSAAELAWAFAKRFQKALSTRN